MLDLSNRFEACPLRHEGTVISWTVTISKIYPEGGAKRNIKHFPTIHRDHPLRFINILCVLNGNKTKTHLDCESPPHSSSCCLKRKEEETL